MGLNTNWQQNVFNALLRLNHKVETLKQANFNLIKFSDKLVINLVCLPPKHTPNQLIALQTKFKQEGVLMVNLWEDVWAKKQKQVLSRINSFLGLNISLHARKAFIQLIDEQQTTKFLNDNHLQGYVKASYSYGLVLNNELMALASFSKVRAMKTKGENYTSAELVRFATKDGFTIVGGLSKLIKYFTKQVKINDLMSYADKDWSLGNGYFKIGFNLSETTDPAFLYLASQTNTRYFPHRLPKALLNEFNAQKKINFDEFFDQKGFVKLFNTGNLKFHLHLQNA